MTLSLRAFAASLILLVCSACSQDPADHEPVTQDSWIVDSAASRVEYVSVKAGDVVEANHFEAVSGSVAPGGEARIAIDLASVSTGIDIRDERMRGIFFDTASYPEALVTAQVDPAALAALGPGDSRTMTLDGTLAIKGVAAPFQAPVKVSRTGADTVLVESTAPVIVDAADLELASGLARLQQIAGLPSISPLVPVTFSLNFTR
ncbi:YceI family protein [Qipengyuania nanhaisediminis]|uniref:YceI family protein n=1 Tax=Qipengyuania nanhaisediminis TaxID=604088 RepID=UPI0038B3AE78